MVTSVRNRHALPFPVYFTISVAWALRYSITSGARYYCHLERRISIAWALRCSISSGALYYCHLGRRISAWALRCSISSGARYYCHLGRRISAWALRYSITSGARYYCHLGRKISREYQQPGRRDTARPVVRPKSQRVQNHLTRA